MTRRCPACNKATIPPGAILLGNTECLNCRSIVGVNSIVAAMTFPIIIAVALVSALIVYQSFGYIYAIVLFTVPIGALGYVVARYSPLQVKGN